MDSKTIEEKAINELKRFIEDSTVISQYINDNDKEPCWDGHLYLYSDGKRDKSHLIGRVPIQIKGKVVKEIQTANWKYPLKKEDLQAYLHEPTFFIVCQIAERIGEKKLFFKELLPDTVRHLLRDMGTNATRMTKFCPLTENLQEFEEQLTMFYRNNKKMVSFGDNGLMTLEDALKIHENKSFLFNVPVIGKDIISQLKYLSTHDNHIYAFEDRWKIDIPIDGTARFSFKRDIKQDVSVGEKVFYNGYKNEIINGRIVITIGGTLQMNVPMDASDNIPPKISLINTAKTLREAIQQAEFVIALHENGVLRIGEQKFSLKVNDHSFIERLRAGLEKEKAFQAGSCSTPRAGCAWAN